MIRFYAQMFDATMSTLIDQTQRVYTIAQYNGCIDPGTQPPVDILWGKDGTTLSTSVGAEYIYPNLSYDSSNNIGILIANVAKNIHNNEGYWPKLRLLKTSDYDDNYLEWDPGQPTGFNIKVDGVLSRWDTCLQWSDSRDYECIVFVKASHAADLLSRDIHYSGGMLLPTLTTHDVEFTTLVGKSTGNFTCDLPQLTNEAVLIEQDFKVINSTSAHIAKTVIPDGTFDYYYGVVVVSRRDATSYWLVCALIFTPINPGRALMWREKNPGTDTTSTLYRLTDWNAYYTWLRAAYSSNAYIDATVTPYIPKDVPVYYTDTKLKSYSDCVDVVAEAYNFGFEITSDSLYEYLMKSGGVVPEEPDSDVDPEDIPPEDEPPEPIDPDDPDPYYDPTSDPHNPDYDPTKDPDSPSYDPTQPSTPWRPPTVEDGGNPPVQPIPADIEVPLVPPSFVTNNSLFTLYNPSGGDLNSLANFLWSPQWSIDTFKKIFANPLDCILGLMVMPLLPAATSTKEMAVGNIPTGVTMRYFTHQFCDFDCGTFKIEEYYASYLDYAPYTDVSLYLPYIGDQKLNTDEVMNKTVGIKYRFDLATGDCVAFVSVDGSILYSFSGNCASRLPLSSNNWSGMLPAFTGALTAAGSVAAGLPALGAASALAVTSMKQKIAHTGSMSGSPGLMGIQIPYLIITRPRQALPLSQNSFTGYPSFMTQSLGSLSGYTEVEACHLEHVPCTAEELEEINRLLKEGVLF